MIAGLRRWLIRTDQNYNLSLYELTKRVRDLFRSQANAVRRIIASIIIRSSYHIQMKRSGSLRLHLGCGDQHLHGYVNLDWRKTDATDYVCDVIRLPYPDSSIDRIESYHLLEHIPHPKVDDTLVEWHRVLKLGGKLVIECPDLDKSLVEYLDGNEERLFNIFGLQRFPGDTHKFGYNFDRLATKLMAIGFTDVHGEDPEDYHKFDEPCLRIIARKY